MALPDFEESTIRAYATDSSYYRGEDYYEIGAVRNLVLEGDAYRAHVHGTRRYTVRIRGSGDDLDASCTCPYDWGGICKHIVATMLAILDQPEGGQAPKRISVSEPEESVPVDDILASLSAEQLRSFVRLQISEYPKLAENLKIFSQGRAETDKTVEAYDAEITADLEAGDFKGPHDYEYNYYDRYDDDYDAEDDSDTVDGILRPYRDTASKYQAQGNWIESAKIHEAIVQACTKMAAAERIDEDDQDYDDYDEIYEDYLESECRREAQQALAHWAETLSEATPKKDKQRVLKRFVEIFAKDLYSLGSKNWEEAFKAAVRTASEAKIALSHLKGLKVKRLNQDSEKAGALLHLLNLSGDTDRFIRVGKNAIHRHPHLALPLAEKLMEVKKRTEAIKIAQAALKRTENDDLHISFEHDETRELLLRFLIRIYDPRKDYRRLIQHSKLLLFEKNEPDDYLFLRDLLRTRKEREQLIQEIKTNCSPDALIDILSLEERWEDLLECARSHTEEPEFPQMIQVLQDRFPAECFKIYQKVLWKIVNSGTGQGIYRQAAHHARQMAKIPNHEETFAKLIWEIIDKYSRRSGLINALGDMAELGKAWKDRMRKAWVEKATPRQVKEMGLDDLAALCPAGDEDMEKLPYMGSQRNSAALVWAILTVHGGKMDAANITTAIAEHRKVSKQSAGAVRSNGLKILETLSYAGIDREGNRLREVRLIKSAAGS